MDFVKGIVLVSPYLYPSQGSSIKLIFSTPLLGNIILRILGKKIINTMLIKSSSPMKAPLSYQRLVNILSQPQILYTAIIEKSPIDDKVLKRLAQSNIPVALIFGEKDSTSKQSEQVIKNMLEPLIEVQIKKAGHALPFTNPKELARAVNNFIVKLSQEKK